MGIYTCRRKQLDIYHPLQNPHKLDWRYKCKTTNRNLLEKNRGNPLWQCTGLGFFLDKTLKVQNTKAKIGKWDYMKLKSFCAATETISSMKRQLTAWSKIFSNCISYEELIFRIYKSLKQLTRKKIKRIWFKNRQEI
jgi:hypothetical protein